MQLCTQRSESQPTFSSLPQGFALRGMEIRFGWLGTVSEAQGNGEDHLGTALSGHISMLFMSTVTSHFPPSSMHPSPLIPVCDRHLERANGKTGISH